MWGEDAKTCMGKGIERRQFLKVLGVSSVMPKEFDKAALEAAEKIHFLPATHKKSKAGVSQKLTVEYDFKP